jgi:hypothetical protein
MSHLLPSLLILRHPFYLIHLLVPVTERATTHSTHCIPNRDRLSKSTKFQQIVQGSIRTRGLVGECLCAPESALSVCLLILVEILQVSVDAIDLRVMEEEVRVSWGDSEITPWDT